MFGMRSGREVRGEADEGLRRFMIAEGSKFAHFQVERRIGSGSTGTVYRARSLDSNMTVAIKVLHPHLAEIPGVVTMFDEEAQVGLQLSHPHIVQTIYVGRHDGLPFIVFEYVNGVALDILLQRGPLTEGQCVWVMRQIGQALRQLASKSIVHQDIKPDNILIDNAGNAKLTDLGFARLPLGKIDWDGFSAGTITYMSPEQARGAKGVTVDARADLYALGATIYHAATGQPPFVAERDRDLIQMHLTKKPLSVHARNPLLSGEFAAVLDKLLQKDPQQRYQHAEELLLALRMLKVAAVPPVVTASRVY